MKIDHKPWSPEPSRADRKIAWKSKRNGNGALVVNDRVMLAGSFKELSWLLIMPYRQDVAEVFEQVRFNWIDEHGEPRITYIDMVVLKTDGTYVGFTIKPYHLVMGDFLHELPMISYQAQETGFLDDFRLLTERDICPVELYNATMMHGMRRPDPEADTAAARVVGEMSFKATIGELSQAIGLGNRGFRALVRLVSSHHLRLVTPERIDLPTLVYKSSNVHPENPASLVAA